MKHIETLIGTMTDLQESMGVAMIEKLTEDDYKEVQIFDIPPKFFRGIGGTHTFSYKGGVLALDFVKRERYSVFGEVMKRGSKK